ncbi:4-alpha-monomethylsterol monooxygenase [Acrasis kona]|uniref:4-alpha-monomethylsterol monooxygenase n=1 Tax=Acrasis kona TaxID=1008807 RepID=A0AAW2ZJX3_9EUKA
MNVTGIEVNDLGVVECLWQHLLTTFGPQKLSTIVTLIYLFVVYIGTSLPYALIYKYKPAFLYKYKIQDEAKTEKLKKIQPTDWKCIKQLLINHFVVLIPSAIGIYPALRYVNADFGLPLPSWTDTIVRIFLYFVIEDTFFYWGHRFFHTKWGYNNVHYLHHQYQAPIAMASSYAHLAEFIVLGTGFALGPAIIGINHLFTLWVWIFVRQVEALDCHCGFDFPWHLSKFLPFYCGPHHHDHHHKTYGGNFASTFTWWDWMMGTDKKYREDCQKEAKKKVN